MSWRMSVRSRRSVLALVLVAGVVAAGMWSYGSDAIARRLTAAARTAAEAHGIELKAQLEMTWAGISRVAFSPVEAVWATPDVGSTRLQAARAVVTINWLRALRNPGDMAGAVGGIHLEAPRVDVSLSRSPVASPRDLPPSDQSSEATAGVSRHPITISIDAGEVHLHGPEGDVSLTGGQAEFAAGPDGFDLTRLRLTGPGGGLLRVEGAPGSDGGRIAVEGQGLSLARFGSLIGGAWPVVAGRVDLSGTMEGLWSALRFDGSIRGEEIIVAHRGERYRADSIQASVSATRGAISVHDLTAVRGEGQIGVTGSWSIAQGMDFDVTARGLHLPRDVPVLAAYGMDGRADFEGTLRGRFVDLQLDGLLQLGRGRLWHTPISWANGLVTLNSNGLHFDEATVAHGVSRYALEGTVQFARDEAPGRLELELQAAAGRLENLLTAVGWEVAAAGVFDGTLQFSGPFGSIEASGDLALGQGAAYDQPFDAGRLRFAWQGDKVEVEAFELALDGGTLRAGGHAGSHSIELAFAADRWPLGSTAAFTGWLPVPVTGRVSTEGGRIGGTPAQPTAQADIRIDSFDVDGMAFSSVAGPITLTSDGRLQTDGVVATRADGATYRLHGEVQDVSASPRVDVQIDLAGERLSRLLALGRIDLPVEIFDGQVSGSVALHGAAGRPQASFDLLWSQTPERKDGLELSFDVRNGRLELRRFGFTPT